ncbi:MAG: GldG family protein [Clostridia bacterium]|nr:GldG family protein [Clostridia bacterium]
MSNTKNTKTSLKTTKMGAYSAFLTLIVVAFVIVVNLMVGELPSTVTKIDTSSLKLYTLTDASIQLTKGLQDDVVMYLVAQSGTEDSNIKELLDRYASYSSRIKVEYVDPTSNPGFLSSYADANVTSNSVIVKSAKRSTVVLYEEIYTVGYTEEDYYNYYMTGQVPSGTSYFNGEGKLTTALDYVTSDTLPTLYVVTGHGETDLADVVLSDIKAENILVETLELLSVTEIPSDANTVIMNIPVKDISETERDVLLAYMDRGGKLILISDYVTCNPTEMPNLCALTEAYGLRSQPGLMIEGSKNSYMTYPFVLLPALNASSSFVQKMESANVTSILQLAHGILPVEGTEHQISPILSTTSEAFLIPVNELETRDSFEKKETDIAGTFHVAAVSTDPASTGKLFWVSSLSFLLEDFYSYNGDLFMSVLTTLCEKTASIAIAGKALQVQSLVVSSAAVTFWGAVLVIVLPVGCALCGFLIWNRRRKR